MLPTTSQRSMQRRSPAADPGPPPTVPARAISPGAGSQLRASASSLKSTTSSSTGSRRQNGIQQSTSSSNTTPLSTIEKSVTHLLVATKQLLETLTQWSRHQATDAQVSDVYVRLGYEFNIACRAFTAINVDVTDLGNVPESLRHILESTLSQEASVESLERYLPKIRDIIINLLHGLKRKQQKLRQKQSKDSGGESSIPRNSSVSSVGSTSTGLTSLLDQGISNNSIRDESGDERRATLSSDGVVPPRTSSASSVRRPLPPRDQSRQSIASDQSTMSSATMQSIPVLPPYPQAETSVTNIGDVDVDNFPPPPPPPKQQNALAALQRGGDLERRASRRYSAYQISKHLGASPNGVVPMLPSTQNSPIPNRGRNDARESMRAVQNRGEQRHTRQQASRPAVDASPSRKPVPTTEEGGNRPALPAPDVANVEDSPIVKTPVDKVRQQPVNFDAPSAILQGPPSDALPIPSTIVPDDSPGAARKQVNYIPSVPEHQVLVAGQGQTAIRARDEKQFTPELSPPPGKELVLFLQYKTKVKKFVLSGGYNDLSIARLQLAFIEKFAWNTHNNGVDLPDIYLQDPVSGVRHELEDLNDIKDRSVLVLNVEVLDEVKRHIDEGFVGIKKMVEGVKTAVDDQQVTIQRVSERQQDAAKEIARIQVTPAPPREAVIEADSRSTIINQTKLDSQAPQRELISLRRELAVLRQTYSAFQTNIQDSMATIRKAAGKVKTVTEKATAPKIDGGSGRAHLNSNKETLERDSDRLVPNVDDLQDRVEDLRRDVVTRGVRPLPRQLEEVAKDISKATMELTKMQDFVKAERPLWTKVWEMELKRICTDKEDLTQIDDLMVDLQDDLEKVSTIFSLVEEATKEQMKDAPGAPASRGLSRSLNHIVAADPAVAKEGVLGEVRALQPNHENRLEAIERAEKLRRKELESRRGGEFEKELGNFVEEGKLKKSGGFEEVERARKAKDEKIRREVWERQNGMTQADALVGSDAPIATEAIADSDIDGVNMEESAPSIASAGQ